MKAKKISETTINRSIFNKAYLCRVKKCSLCPPNKGCNSNRRTNWRKHSSWKNSKRKYQWKKIIL